jgi:hypothetical protein
MTDVIQPRKLTEIKSVVEENNLEVRGDNSLLDKERVEHFPQHEIDMWMKELESMYSHLPRDLLGHIVDLWTSSGTSLICITLTLIYSIKSARKRRRTPKC